MNARLTAQQVLLFETCGYRLGVFVAEVTRLTLEPEKPLLPVPFAHPGMAGLLDGGEVGALPIFDLQGVLTPGARPSVSQPGATIAVFTTERGPVGLRTDRRGTAQEYRYLDDFQEEADRLDELPEQLRHLVMGVGELPDGLFYFFSPEAFVMSLQSFAAVASLRGAGGGSGDAGDRA